MTNLDNILKTLAIITAIVVAIGGLLAAILEVLGKLKQVWEILKPSIKYLAFLGSQIIPNGAIMWIFLYSAAENSNRLAEPQVFLLLVGEVTIALSLCAVFWGMWFYPSLLRPLFVKQGRNVQSLPSSNQPSTDHKQEPNIERSSNEEYQ